MTNKLVSAKNTIKRRPWPEKHRQRLAEIAKAKKPWKKSTGPKSEDGKAAAARNALKHGFRSEDMKEIRALLRLQRACVKASLSCYDAA